MMVQANLDDLKTNTRRIKGLEIVNKVPGNYFFSHFKKNKTDGINAVFKNKDQFISETLELHESIRCPYGKPGDVLWVRESFQWMEGFAGSGYYVYKTDFKLVNGEWQKEVKNKFHDVEIVRRWRPTIHMPKEAARIWLQVTDIRVERLQEITEEDAKAEGVKTHKTKLGDSYFNYASGYCNGLFSAKDSFRTLWQSINGANSWEDNPWVWVIKYKVLSTTGKPELQTIKELECKK